MAESVVMASEKFLERMDSDKTAVSDTTMDSSSEKGKVVRDIT